MHPFLSFLPLLPIAAAHFTLDWPASRGFDEDKMPTFPCGGFDTPSSNRTTIALNANAIPVDITFHHSQTAVSYLLALGSDPGSSFNITLEPTLGAHGLGEFCLPSIPLDSKTLGTSLHDGQNATLQVVTDGDSGGGLYACADIIFSSKITSNTPSSCKNNTGVGATPFSGSAATRIANESNANGDAQSGASTSGAASVTNTASTATASSSSSSSTSSGIAAPLQTAGWGVLGAAVIGGLAIL
ncbi:hypothetical protein BGW36DRAFT_309413 [Talaromyces proteolyticus]|uniref:Copper acquisition factor BIM1-like domain-containing protein n=1 Tax=Talaromyces proteolyticus TaxID=1131652 RepID=A0AAD4KE20_9EURO|nr:uncharacterized protein BGW36DRAFT_309413 [Talaromyces proteolyticus]KAH8688814.1 hypothetical protein BGW36DRAFT_309413 [Talaromyces proteolyticus]